MSSVSDPEIAAAFGGPAVTTSTAPVSDPEISAAFPDATAASQNIRMPDGSLYTGQPWQDAILRSFHPPGGDTPLGAVVGNIVGGTAGSVTGGIRGIADIATGKGLDTAVKDVQSAQQAFAYKPKGKAAQATTAVMGSDWNPLNWPDVAGRKLGDFSADMGLSPSVSTALRIAPDALAAALGLRKAGAAESEPLGAGEPEAIPAETAQDIANRAAASQSMGAAGAATDVSTLSPQLQQAVRATAQKTGGAINPDALANHAEADMHGVDLMEGQATRDPTTFSNEQNSTNPAVMARRTLQEQQLTDALDNIRQKAGPSTVQNDPIQNGQIAVDALKAYDEPVKADIKTKYQALVDANGGSVPIDSGQFLANVDAQLKKQYLTDSVPPAAKELLNSLRADEPLDFEGFEAARSRLAEAQRNGGSEGVAAGIIRNQLEQLPLSPEASQLKGLADSARAAAKARFDALDADPAYQAAVNDTAKRGAPSPLADKFLDKYALGAPKANLDLMLDKLGDEGGEAVTSHTLSAIRDAAITPNGKVSANGYNRAMQKFGPKLDSLVGDDNVDSLESLGRVITNVKVPPEGHFVNYSKSGVLRNAATGVAQDIGGAALNAKTLGMGVPIVKGIAERNFAKRVLAPGAGLGNLSDLAKP